MNTIDKEVLYTREDLENLLEYMPYEIWLKDKDGKHVYINQKGADEIGLKKEDIIGKTDKELRPNGFWEKCNETDKQVMREQKPLFYEDKFEEGKDKYYKVFKFPIKDSENNFKLNGGIANEVTHSKYLYKELEDLFNELQQSENEKLENIKSLPKLLSNLNKMIKSTSVNLFFIDESKEKLNLYMSCDNNNIFINDSSINIDYEDFLKLYNNKLKIGRDDKLNYKFKEIYSDNVEINNNGIFKIIPFNIDNDLVGITYIYYEKESEYIDMYDSYIDDISHRMSNFLKNINLKYELQKSLHKSQSRLNNLEKGIEILEEAIDSEMVKVNFLENMSHEFRTPINIILMITKLLLSAIKEEKFDLDQEKVISYLNTSKQNSYRILRLVNNILDSTILDSDYKKIDMDNYNIINIIEDIVLYSAQYIKDSDKIITFDTEEEEVILSCNPDSIEKIMLNLISNSIKFTGDNGKIDIDIKVNKEEERLYVHIKNDGESISKKDEKLIFNKFVQVENHIRRQNEGCGIGLYLVKKLVELHEGKIWVNSEVECGAEFIFYIPIKTINNDDVKMYYIEPHSIIDKCNIEFSDIYM